MEVVAWSTHKYVMHGILWSWHKSHHTLHTNKLEKNDLFAVVFSIPSILLVIIGHELEYYPWIKFIGYGILSYGIFYFLFHDILVHRRIKTPFKARNGYLKRLIHAHYIHHKKHTKHSCEAFGFLFAPKKYKK